PRSRLFFFSSRRRHTRLQGDWSSDVCSSDLCSRIRRQEATGPLPAGAFVSCSTSSQENRPDLTSNRRSESASAGSAIGATTSSKIGRASCREREEIAGFDVGGTEDGQKTGIY